MRGLVGGGHQEATRSKERVGKQKPRGPCLAGGKKKKPGRCFGKVFKCPKKKEEGRYKMLIFLFAERSEKLPLLAGLLCSPFFVLHTCPTDAV